MLELSHIRKVFNAGTVDEAVLFDDFSLSVEEGSFVSIVGSNGSGKTTLLNLICGTLAADSGKILLDGRDITSMPEYRRAAFIGRVHQNPQSGTCPDLTVTENMALADNKGKTFGLSLAVNSARVAHYRELVSACGMGLENRMNVKVGSLSGGQRQALALVIAAMTDIRLLILDEHTAALDPKTSETIMHITDSLVKERHLTALMVTHNLRFATDYGTRLLMMHNGKAIIDKAGEEKQNIDVRHLLDTFENISIELGN